MAAVNTWLLKRIMLVSLRRFVLGFPHGRGSCLMEFNFYSPFSILHCLNYSVFPSPRSASGRWTASHLPQSDCRLLAKVLRATSRRKLSHCMRLVSWNSSIMTLRMLAPIFSKTNEESPSRTSLCSRALVSESRKRLCSRFSVRTSSSI